MIFGRALKKKIKKTVDLPAMAGTSKEARGHKWENGEEGENEDYIAAQTRRREEGKEREWMWTAAGSQHGNQRASGSTENLTGAGG